MKNNKKKYIIVISIIIWLIIFFDVLLTKYVDIFNKFQNEEVQKYEDYMKDVFDIESYLK